MKVKDTEECIIITREAFDSVDSFKDAFETGIVTLMVGTKSGKINGIKIWKNEKMLKGAVR